MPIKKYTTEQIIGMLRDAENLLADGNTIAMTSKKLFLLLKSPPQGRKSTVVSLLSSHHINRCFKTQQLYVRTKKT